MKRLFIFGIMIFVVETAEATHTILRNAGNLTSGVLPNTRLDPSSVTLQGNTLNISTIASGLNTLQVSSGTTFLKTDGSTQTKTGGLTINGVTTLSSLTVVGLDYLNTSGSTQTKIGSLTINGVLTVSSYTGVSTIGSGSIINESIRSEDILDGTITTDDILNETITTNDILNGTIINSDIAAETIGGGLITDGSLGTADYGNNTITGAKIADNTFSGSQFSGVNVVLSSHIANGTIASVDLAGIITISSLTVGGVMTSTNVISVAGVKFPDGSIQISSVTPGGGGGGGGVTYSTHEICLCGSGNVVKSTVGFDAQGITWRNMSVSTYHVTSASAYMTKTSTNSDIQFSVMRATNPGSIGIGNFTAIHSASFTINLGSLISATTIPDTLSSVGAGSSILPNEILSLWTTITESSGTPAGDSFGVNLRAWKEP